MIARLHIIKTDHPKREVMLVICVKNEWWCGCGDYGANSFQILTKMYLSKITPNPRQWKFSGSLVLLIIRVSAAGPFNITLHANLGSFSPWINVRLLTPLVLLVLLLPRGT